MADLSPAKGKKIIWEEGSCCFCPLVYGQYLWQYLLQKGLNKDLIKKKIIIAEGRSMDVEVRDG